jgi:hypothetical protein
VVGLPEVGGLHHRYHRLAACPRPRRARLRGPLR